MNGPSTGCGRDLRGARGWPAGPSICPGPSLHLWAERDTVGTRHSCPISFQFPRGRILQKDWKFLRLTLMSLTPVSTLDAHCRPGGERGSSLQTRELAERWRGAHPHHERQQGPRPHIQLPRLAAEACPRRPAPSGECAPRPRTSPNVNKTLCSKSPAARSWFGRKRK